MANVSGIANEKHGNGDESSPRRDKWSATAKTRCAAVTVVANYWLD
jgi:hypothetical protein